MTVWERTDAPLHETGHTDTYNWNVQQFLKERQGSVYKRQSEWEAAKGSSLYDSIAAEGARDPVHLGTDVGSLGKPQVVGGHHRIAAQADINPNQPMPVLHHEGGIVEARASSKQPGGFKYS
jgi:hypothetical protein